MTDNPLPTELALESLEVGAAPLIRRLLSRLHLQALFQRHLPKLAGKTPALDTPTVLCLVLTNLLLARQPLYALAGWAARRVPEHLGLRPGPTALLNDDRIGRALDHLRRADRASLLTALVRHVVTEFDIDLDELHQDTTTITFQGAYAGQDEPAQPHRPPRITLGYNKEHRPDLKQLLFSVTISDDGAVPVHCKVYDGNTSDTEVHQDTWLFLSAIHGGPDFLYVADSKLCTRANLSFIDDRTGRFLTVMPATRAEDGWFRGWLQEHPVAWREVHREANPRRRKGPDVVYHGFESPQRSREGYRVLWYRSSQKEDQDRQARAERLQRARTALEQLQGVGRRPFGTGDEARLAAERVLQAEQVERWLRVQVVEEVEVAHQQIGPGRPGPSTRYRAVESTRYRIRPEEDGEALARAARTDGLFPLMSNDGQLRVAEALVKYKYQPFVEKRHAQLKSGFGVTPRWLKSVCRVESMRWLYYVVELVQALLEREVRQWMEEEGSSAMSLYPEGRDAESPTAVLVLGVLEGHRRHRLLDEQGQELRRFHDSVSGPAQRILTWLGVDLAGYGLE